MKAMNYSVSKSKIPHSRTLRCDREDEHACPPWMNNYKTVYGPPLLSSFLIIDIQKIFRRNFKIPKLKRITRLQGIEYTKKIKKLKEKTNQSEVSQTRPTQSETTRSDLSQSDHWKKRLHPQMWKLKILKLLAELLGMYDFETNLISYWTVDVLSQVIRKCQSKSMGEMNIKMCILWMHFILLTIHKKHPSRKKLFRLLCLMFNRGMRCLPKMVAIPHPYHIKQKMDKQREEKKDTPISENTQAKMPDDVMTKQVEEPKQKEKEEGVGVAEIKEQEEKTKESRVGVELEVSDEESLSMEEESEEDELMPKKDYGDDFSDSSNEDVGQEDEENLSLEEEIEIPDEIQAKLKLIPGKITAVWKTNKRDFYILIDIIYRIFANRFKYIVIWEAFAKPPQPKIIGIGNNLKIPKKAKVLKPVSPPKVTLNIRTSSNSVEQKRSVRSKPLSAKEGSLMSRYFQSVVKKNGKRKIKKRSKHIRPLAEAVNKRFFDLVADYKYKEIIHAQYMKKMEAIKRTLNINSENNDKVIEDLKTLVAKYKKKKPVPQKSGKFKGTKTKKR